MKQAQVLLVGGPDDCDPFGSIVYHYYFLRTTNCLLSEVKSQDFYEMKKEIDSLTFFLSNYTCTYVNETLLVNQVY